MTHTLTSFADGKHLRICARGMQEREAATVANISEEARAARREYQRQWREKNKDRVREYERRRWERLAVREQGDEWQQQQNEKTSA